MRPIVITTLAMLAVTTAVGAGDPEDPMSPEPRITSPAFDHGRPIPQRYTADGDNTSPPLNLDDPPEGTVSFALIVDDPDAPRGTWTHWVVWDIPASARSIPEGGVPDGAVQGRNSWGRADYGGPAPPSGTHRYVFKLYALDVVLDLAPETDKAGLLMAMEAHVLGRAELMGTYAR
jgi:Raf kinase inhibitor-like YbhB/YbcL family protein